MAEINNPKLTGISAITSPLNFGSTGDQVKALQQYLIGLGYDNVKADGVFGPVTEAAVKQFQLDNGLTSDGNFGPQTLAKAQTLGSSALKGGTPGSGKVATDSSNMFNTDTGELNPNFVPKTQEELDQFYNASVAAHPVFKGNSPDALSYAATTGDFSNLLNPDGKPFSQADQEAVVAEAKAALQPGFDATKRYDTANTEDTLKLKNLDYGNFLNSEKTNFQNDKNTLDKNAADNGVLFSGGRIQKEKALQDTYQRNLATKLATSGADIGGTLRDYQYKYGDKSVQTPSLSQYFQLGTNTYNPNVARGGVQSGNLSSIYNPSGYNFQGTAVNTNNANAQVRAAGLLANKGNKLLKTGYLNQF